MSEDKQKAIFSKNMLLMRKTNDFIRMQDVMFVGIYLVITLIMGLGFSFSCYMLIFWMFSMIQNSDFMRDMKKCFNAPELTREMCCALLDRIVVGGLPKITGKEREIDIVYKIDIISVLRHKLPR